MKFLFTLFFLFVSQSFAAEGTHLLAVTSEESAGKTFVYLEFNQPLSVANVEARFLRRTIEWDLQNVLLKKDKLFRTVAAGQISNVYVTQSDDSTTRIRVNLENGLTASDFNQRASFSQNGKRLIFTMDSAAALASGGAKEMSKTYEVAPAGDAKMAAHIEANSTLKAPAASASETSAPASSAAAVTTEDVTAAPALEEKDLALDNKNENEIPLTTPKTAAATVGAASPMRLGIGLLAVVLLLMSVFFVGKKINQKRLAAPFSHDSIKVVAQKYLGPKRNLTLVRVAGEYLLLGVTDHNIALIKTLSVVDDEIPELSPNDFKTALKDLTKNSDKSAAPVDDLVSAAEDSFSVSSMNEIKNVMRTRKYIDEVDF